MHSKKNRCNFQDKKQIEVILIRMEARSLSFHGHAGPFNAIGSNPIKVWRILRG
jgi:hypothetical protein